MVTYGATEDQTPKVDDKAELRGKRGLILALSLGACLSGLLVAVAAKGRGVSLSGAMQLRGRGIRLGSDSDTWSPESYDDDDLAESCGLSTDGSCYKCGADLLNRMGGDKDRTCESIQATCASACAGDPGAIKCAMQWAGTDVCLMGSCGLSGACYDCGKSLYGRVGVAGACDQIEATCGPTTSAGCSLDQIKCAQQAACTDDDVMEECDLDWTCYSCGEDLWGRYVNDVSGFLMAVGGACNPECSPADLVCAKQKIGAWTNPRWDQPWPVPVHRPVPAPAPSAPWWCQFLENSEVAHSIVCRS